MTKLITANKDHVLIIKELAKQLWPDSFASILSVEQIHYMMNLMYSIPSLEKQMNEGHKFVIAQNEGQNIGYVSYETNHNATYKTKIHKLYISPIYQRKGVGKKMVDYVAQKALKSNNTALFLNVNKNNKTAISFYKKHGFFLVKEEVIDIGDGFIMDDFVFELSLKEKVY